MTQTRVGRCLHDGRPVDGAHGGGEGAVQGVVEDGRADVGHDGLQQRLAQVLLVGGHGRGRGRRLKEQEVNTPSGQSAGPLQTSKEPKDVLPRPCRSSASPRRSHISAASSEDTCRSEVRKGAQDMLQELLHSSLLQLLKLLLLLQLEEPGLFQC